MLPRKIAFLVIWAIIVSATNLEPGRQRKIVRKQKQHVNRNGIDSPLIRQAQDISYRTLDIEHEPDDSERHPAKGHRTENRHRKRVRHHRWPYGTVAPEGVQHGQGKQSQKNKDKGDQESEWDLLLAKVSTWAKSDEWPTQEDGRGAGVTLRTKPNGPTINSKIPAYSLIMSGHCWTFEYRWLLLGLCIIMMTADAIFIAVIVHKFYIKKEHKHSRFGFVKTSSDICAVIGSLEYDDSENLSKSLFKRLKARAEPEIMRRYFGGDEDQFAGGVNFTTLIADLKCRARLWRYKKKASVKDNVSSYLSARDMVSESEEESIFERENFIPPSVSRIQDNTDSDFDSL